MLLHNYDRLEENGQTALGPALVISILLAARSSGSQVSTLNTIYTDSVVCSAFVLCKYYVQVIVCTDGLANKGVGNLDGDICVLDEQEFSVILVCSFSDLSTGEAYVNAQTFYNDLGTLAHQNG